MARMTYEGLRYAIERKSEDIDSEIENLQLNKERIKEMKRVLEETSRRLDSLTYDGVGVDALYCRVKNLLRPVSVTEALMLVQARTPSESVRADSREF